eukprot:jgi/Mesvir1/17189/Mv07609-RA.2
MEALLKGLTHKLAKVIIPTIEAIQQAVSLFGSSRVDVKPIVKSLPAVLSNADAKVRQNAKVLAAELARWVGRPVIDQVLNGKIRDAQKAEVDAELDKLPSEAPVATRRLRSEMEAPEEETGGDAGAEGGVGDEPAVKEVDPYDFAEPQDILSQLNGPFWENLQAPKWSDKRDALLELSKLASAPKLAPGDYGELFRSLKKLLTDVNVVVVAEAANAAAHLARGLRKEAASGARLLLPVLLDKCKDKKASVVRPCADALRAFHLGEAIHVAEHAEEVTAALNHKVPSVRLETASWVAFCIGTNTPRPTVLKIAKELMAPVVATLGDSDPGVRDAAFSCLVAIAVSAGMAPIARTLETLEDVKRKKLEELITAAGGPAKEARAPPPTKGAAAAKPQRPATAGGDKATRPGTTMSSSVLAPHDTNVAPQLASPAKPKMARPKTAGPAVGGKPGGAAGKGGLPAKTPRAAATPAAEDDVHVPYVDAADTEAALEGFLDEAMLAQLKSEAWKERLEAVTRLQELVAEGKESVDAHAEALVRFLGESPGWGEKNIQVLTKVFEVIAATATTAPNFSKVAVLIPLSACVEKLPDMKLRAAASECMMAFCEAVGLQFVYFQVYKTVRSHKNPKVPAEAINWMASALRAFGLQGIALKPLIDFLKEMLASTNAPVRAAAIRALGTLYTFLGPELRGFLIDLKPALMTAIDTEFAKCGYTEADRPEPTRQVRGSVGSAAMALSTSVGFDSIPREDVSAKFGPKLIAEISSADWRTRQAGIAAVDEILSEANMRISVNGTPDVLHALRGRLTDSNKNITISALSTIAAMATAVGPGVEKASKGVMADCLKCWSDQKKQTREAVTRTLDVWASVVPLDRLFGYVIGALADAKLTTDGKKEAFTWLAKHIPSGGAAGADLSLLIKPAVHGLGERAVEVRKAAEETLVELIKCLGTGSVLATVQSMKDASQAAALAILEKNAGIGPSVPPPQVTDASMARPSTASAASRGAAAGAGVVGGADASNLPARPKTAGGRVGGPAVSAPGGALAKARTGSGAVALSQSIAFGGGIGAGSAYGLDGDGRPLIEVDEHKAERGRKAPRKAQKFEEPWPEYVSELDVALRGVVREDLHALLFSNDFKKHTDAVELMQRGLPTHLDAMESCLDLLLKWAVLRICEGNTTSLTKTLDFLSELLDALKARGYRMSDAEANLFVPCVAEKGFGHNLDRVRQQVRKLFRQLTSLYPASKLMAFLNESFKSKSNRVRAECVEEFALMLERHGMEVCAAPAKTVPIVAALMLERDGTLRAAAINALCTVYKLVGEDVWAMIGRVPDSQKKEIENKFRLKAKDLLKDGMTPGEPPPPPEPANSLLAPLPPALATPQAASSSSAAASLPRAAFSQSLPANSRLGTELASIAAAAAAAGGSNILNMSGSFGASFDPTASVREDAPYYPAPSSSAGAGAIPLSHLNLPPASYGAAPYGGAVNSNPYAGVSGGMVPAAPPEPEGLASTSLNMSLAAAPTPKPPMRTASVDPMEFLRASSLNPLAAGGGYDLSSGMLPPVLSDWDRALAYMASPNEQQAVEGMKMVCHELSALASASAAGAPGSATALAAHAADADRLVGMLAAKVPVTFASAAVSARACKYVLNTLMQLFQLRVMATAVPEGTLRTLVSELLLRLLDEDVLKVEDGQQLVRALNVLMLKILENAVRTSSFCVLLSLFRPYDPAAGPSPLPSMSQEAARGLPGAKFLDLIVKCLIKLTKALAQTIHDIDVDKLLLAIHAYLSALGVEEIRRRAVADDKPLRMVKTVLHELTKLKGGAIKSHLSLIPTDTEPPPIILAYIDLNLQNLSQAAGGAAPPTASSSVPNVPLATPAVMANGARVGTPSPLGQSSRAAGVDLTPAPTSATPSGVAASPMADLKSELAAVFKKIGDKATTAAGLEELYRFTKVHPEIDISPHLSKTSEAFRLYIQRGLAKVEAELRQREATGAASAAAGVAPGTVSTAASYKERLRMLESSAPLAGGSGGAAAQGAPGGLTSTATLDSLRERMRSIQAGHAVAPVGADPAGQVTYAPPISQLQESLSQVKAGGLVVPGQRSPTYFAASS